MCHPELPTQCHCKQGSCGFHRHNPSAVPAMSSSLAVCEPKLVAHMLQARVEEVGQALLWLVNDETGAALKARRLQRGPVEAYEEVSSELPCRSLLMPVGNCNEASIVTVRDTLAQHFLLPEDRVVLLTNRGVLLAVAPTFAALHSRAESGVIVRAWSVQQLFTNVHRPDTLYNNTRWHCRKTS